MRKGILKNYEVIICGCCFLILFTNVGLVSTSFSVYQSYIVEIPGVGHTGGSIVLAVRTFASLICIFFVTKYYRVLNCRIGVFIGFLLSGIGFIFYSIANNLPLLCVGAVFAGAGYGLGGTVASTMLIGRWFEDRVGTAAGIAAVGSGVASIIIPPIAEQIITTTSLSISFESEAILAFILGILVLIFLRNDPVDVGMTPYRLKKGSKDIKKNKKQKKKKKNNETARVKEALPRSTMIFMYAAMVCVGAVSIVAVGYLGVLFTTEGFDTADAAILIAISGFTLTISKFCIGYCFDKWGTRLGSMIFFVLLILGLALCCLSANTPFIFAAIAAGVFGLGLSLGSVGISVWSIEVAPPGSLLKTIKNFQIAYVFGGFIFNFLPGILKDVLGNYIISYEIMFVLTCFSAIVVVSVFSIIRKRNKIKIS